MVPALPVDWEVKVSNRVPSEKQSPYDVITAQIIASIEDGVGRCVMPWQSASVSVAMPINAFTEKPYHGVNVIALWAQAASKLYPTGYWASYEQWRKLGAQVRKGERGSVIIFYKEREPDEDSDAGDAADAPRVILRYSHVFNFAQVEGWELPGDAMSTSLVVLNEEVAAFVEATKADIRYGGYEAYYHAKEDYIAMPEPKAFRGSPTSSPTEAYHAVLLHELTHWTGAAHRLDRAHGKRFGDRDYAFEELVAELGAAFLCSAFKLVNAPRPDHAAYIARWLQLLKRDNRAIFAAAGLAQQAVEYLRVLARSEGAK